MILLLQFHIKSNLSVDRSYTDFVHFSEKFIAKNSDSLTADQLPFYMKLMMIQYDTSGILNPQKLYLKLQKQVLTHLDAGRLDLNQFAMVLRLFSDCQVTQSSALFDEMNYRLSQGYLSDLSETGFVDCFIGFK